MPVRRRHHPSLLQEVTVCLMRLSESQAAPAAIQALAEFLAGFAIWHTVDLFSDSGMHRRLSSSRCPRGFAPFVTRLGVIRRPDGSYPGTFARSTLLLVKAADPASADRCLVGAIGLDKASPLNDGTTLACIGAVMRQALARVLWFEADCRRSILVDACVTQRDEFAMLLDEAGDIVERHPSHAGDLGGAELLETLKRSTASRAPHSLELSHGSRRYDIRLRWVTSDGPLAGRHLLVHATQRSPAPRAVAERLRGFGLSKRESQVAELMFTGRTNQRIAETLFISRDTVKTHCRRIFGKMGISRRTEFLRVAGE